MTESEALGTRCIRTDLSIEPRCSSAENHSLVHTSSAREKVDEVMDAHLELLSVVVCTIIWAVCYGWIEANAIGPFQVLYFDKHGHLLWWLQLAWWNHLGFYRLIFLIMSTAITFSFGLLEVHRMWRHKKRYFAFTALGAYPFSWMVEDMSYFVYVDSKLDRLGPDSWTNWFFGGFSAGQIWIPTWRILALVFSFTLFFLAYRSALYSLLLEKEVEETLTTQNPNPEQQELASGSEPSPQEPALQLESLIERSDNYPEPNPETQVGSDGSRPSPPEPETQEEIRKRLLVKKTMQKDA